MQLVWRLVVPVVNLFCDGEPIKRIWSVIFISSFLSSLVSILPPRSKITSLEMKIGNEKQACAHFWFCLVIFWNVWSSDGLCLSSHRASSDVTSIFQMLSWLMKMKDTKQQSYLLNVRDCRERPLFILYPKRTSNHVKWSNKCCRPHPESNRPFLSRFLVGQWPLVVALIITAAKEEVNVCV